jgi:hypothetical protein
LAALPYLQKVVNLGHFVQYPFFGLFPDFRVVFCIRGIQFRVSACQNPVIGSGELPYNDLFVQCLACGF